jgi:hypothetical protein
MKRHWDEQELAEQWSLSPDERQLLCNRTDRSRLGCAVLLKFFQIEGRFPRDRKEIPAAARDHLAGQLGIAPEVFAEYDLTGRSSKRDRERIRSALGFRRATVADAGEPAGWLHREVLALDSKPESLQQAALDWCRRNRIEPPGPVRLGRIIRSVLKVGEEDFFTASYARCVGRPSCCTGSPRRRWRTPTVSSKRSSTRSPGSRRCATWCGNSGPQDRPIR